MGGDKALASLLLTLTALGTVTPQNITYSIGNVNNKLNKEGLIIDEDTIEKLKEILNHLLHEIQKSKNIFFQNLDK